MQRPPLPAVQLPAGPENGTARGCHFRQDPDGSRAVDALRQPARGAGFQGMHNCAYPGSARDVSPGLGCGVARVVRILTTRKALDLSQARQAKTSDGAGAGRCSVRVVRCAQALSKCLHSVRHVRQRPRTSLHRIL